jgi:hypothetical protein
MVMKKITFTADEYLLDRAERIAKEKGLLSNRRFGSGWMILARESGNSLNRISVRRVKTKPSNTATPASNVLGFY